VPADAPVAASQTDDGSVIDVIAFYTPAARDGEGGRAEIEALIDLFVAETNQALADSGVIQRINLVIREEVAYTEASRMVTDLRRIRNESDTYADDIHDIRDVYAADVVQVIIKDTSNGSCGIAGIMTEVSRDSEWWAGFGLTDHRCVDLTFAHELGHNLGLHHDRYELAHLARRALSLHPGYGYVNQRGFDAGATPDDRWLTVMAYWSQCNAMRVRCTSLLRFSNPRQAWLGDRLGVPADVDSMGDDGPADAAAVLAHTVPVVAGFRRNPAARAPMPVGRLPNRTLPMDAGMEVVDVAEAFRDPDGDPLTYTAASSTPVAVTVSAAGAGVTLMAVSEGTATIRVTATDPGGLSAVQVFRVTVEQRVTVPFTDDPIVPGVTPVRAVHFTELRTRIDGLRMAVGLGRLAWTDPVLTAGATPVRLVHLLELRSALAAAYRAAGRAAPLWTDAAPVGGTTPVRAAHLMELRAAVRALE